MKRRSSDPKPVRPTNPKAAAIGCRIRLMREKLRFTQAKLAGMLGVTENAITQYETGRAVPNMEHLEALTAIFNVTREWLLTGLEPDMLIRAQTKAEEAMLAAMRQVPLDQQEMVLGAIRGIVVSFTKKS